MGECANETGCTVWGFLHGTAGFYLFYLKLYYFYEIDFFSLHGIITICLGREIPL